MRHLLKRYIKNIIGEQADTKKDLRSYIRTVLYEEDAGGLGRSLAASEEAAKKKYEAAKQALEAWSKNAEAKKKLEDLAAEAGATGKAAKKRLIAAAIAKDPDLNYDPAVLRKSKEKLQDELDKATEEYGEYDPSVVSYSLRRKKVNEPEESEEDTSAPAKAGKRPAWTKKYKWDGGDAYAMKWTSWPATIKQDSGVGFGKQSEGGEAMGTGPGERWLAYIFNGKVAGGSVSYDVLIGGMKCESKELDSSSSLVRPGTEGLAAYEKARDRLSAVLTQIKNFVTNLDELGKDIEEIASAQDMAKINLVKSFVEEEYENMAGKGEISRARFVAFRRALKTLIALKKDHKTEEKIKPQIVINKRPISVSRPTFIDVAKTIEREVETDVLKDFEKWDVILNVLKDDAFSDPDKFLDAWSSSVSVEEVFRQTDGVFIVNQEKGFFWVPKSNIKDALQFSVVSQGKPKFRFLYW